MLYKNLKDVDKIIIAHCLASYGIESKTIGEGLSQMDEEDFAVFYEEFLWNWDQSKDLTSD